MSSYFGKVIMFFMFHFCSLNLMAETMCLVLCDCSRKEFCGGQYCYSIDPCAKSVQYLELLKTLIFLKIFSTGDILTLVDHTLIDHTACIEKLAS